MTREMDSFDTLHDRVAQRFSTTLTRSKRCWRLATWKPTFEITSSERDVAHTSKASGTKRRVAKWVKFQRPRD